MDSTGPKLGGAGEWLVEKHGTSCRRSWRKPHIVVDANSGEIVAIEVTKKDIDDGVLAGGLRPTCSAHCCAGGTNRASCRRRATAGDNYDERSPA